MGCHGADGQSGDPSPEQTCRATGVSFKWITAFAYDIPFDRIDTMISGGPDWFSYQRYALEAKAGQPATLAQLKQMLKTLLLDRIKLRFHRATKKASGYDLVVAEGGPKLEPARDRGHGDGNFLHRPGALAVYNGTLSDLAASLSAALNSPVVDRTEIIGSYDFALTWTPDGHPPVFDALPAVLGLKLEPVKQIAFEVLVVDHTEGPSIGEVTQQHLGVHSHSATVRAFPSDCAHVEAAAGAFFRSRGLIVRPGKPDPRYCAGRCFAVTASITAKQLRDTAGQVMDWERVKRIYTQQDLNLPAENKTLSNRGGGYWEHMGPWMVMGGIEYREQAAGCFASIDFHFGRVIDQQLVILPFDRYFSSLLSNDQFEAETVAAIEAAAGEARVPFARLRLELETREAQLEARLESEAAATGTGRPGPTIEFVKIPIGSFPMGCPVGDKECRNQLPAHRVEITRAFEIGKYEVTQAQWEVVMGTNPSHFKGAFLPAEMVSWNDTQAFLARLNARHDGYLYRLPTEAEWEYAARAGSNSAVPDSLSAAAWYEANSNQHTHPVGQKQPNAWGLYDMLGNVAEFVQDWQINYHTSSLPIESARPPDAYRVIRGGTFDQSAVWARASARDGAPPKQQLLGVGFRCAREPIP
jgi:uncharacterized protein (TIGR03435 family)